MIDSRTKQDITGNFMTRNFTIAEKAISILLILWGGLSLYAITMSIRAFQALSLIPYISPVTFLEQYHLVYLVPLLGITGGGLLLFNKRWGWVLCLVALLSEALLFLIPTEKGKSVFTDMTSAVIFCSIGLFSLLMFYILVLPAFRQKYNPTRFTWWVIGMLSGLLLMDKAVLYFLSE